MCFALNVLPESGGLLDQDPLWVRRMQLVAEARQQAEELRAKREESAAKHKAATARRGG